MDKAFFQEEVRNGYTVTEKTKESWSVMLDLIGKLKNVCEKHNLTYFMYAGTLLGAVRHQGFIPWDDDADFLMLREDFEKLKDIAPVEFQYPYFLQTEFNEPDIFLGGFARLRNSNTTKLTDVHLNHTGNFGIWIDISVLDNFYEDKYRQRKQVRSIRHLQRLLFAKTYSEYNSFLYLSNLKWNVYKAIASLFTREWLIKQLFKHLTSCKRSENYACFTYHPDRYWPVCMKKKYFEKSVLMKFEGLELPAPVGYDMQLKLQYGNYMDFPPEEKRILRRARIEEAHIPYWSYLFNFSRIAEELKYKTLVIFGAGKMLEYYLSHEGKTYRPAFAVDNNLLKWGTEIDGIPVNCPDTVLDVPKDKLILIICSIYYREIAKQLREMGIDNYYIYVQNKDWL